MADYDNNVDQDGLLTGAEIKIASALVNEGNSARLLARGSGAQGEQIIRTAREHEIPVVENVSLSNALESVPLGDCIPEKVFFALTQVMEYIYRLDDPEQTGLVRNGQENPPGKTE